MTQLFLRLILLAFNTINRKLLSELSSLNTRKWDFEPYQSDAEGTPT
jgi:hypothetical protein